MDEYLNVWVCSIGIMMLVEEDRSAGRQVCHSATLSTTNHTWMDLGLNPSLCNAGNHPPEPWHAVDILYLVGRHWMLSGKSRCSSPYCNIKLPSHSFGPVATTPFPLPESSHPPSSSFSFHQLSFCLISFLIFCCHLDHRLSLEHLACSCRVNILGFVICFS